ISNCCANIFEPSVPCLGTPAELRRLFRQGTHEAVVLTFISMHRMCRYGPPPAAQCRARADLDLPAHAVAAGRVQLPASAALLGLWRGSDRRFGVVGGGGRS